MQKFIDSYDVTLCALDADQQRNVYRKVTLVVANIQGFHFKHQEEINSMPRKLRID